VHNFGYYISALKGGCALKFLHALEIDQALLAHTASATPGVTQKKFSRENLKFGLKFRVLETITSGLVGNETFFQSTCREAGVIT